MGKHFRTSSIVNEEYIQKVTDAFAEFLIENNYFSEFCNHLISFYKKSFNEFCKWALVKDQYNPWKLIFYHPYNKICTLDPINEICLIDKWENYIKDHDL